MLAELVFAPAGETVVGSPILFRVSVTVIRLLKETMTVVAEPLGRVDRELDVATTLVTL